MTTTTTQPRDEERATGATEDYVPLYGFADDRMFLTAAGEVGVVLEVGGTEYECLDPVDLADHAARFESALRQFDEDFTIYQYVMKSDGAQVPHREAYQSPVVRTAVGERTSQLETCSTISTYMVILYSRFRQPVTPLEKLKHAAMSRWSENVIGTSVEQQVYFARAEMIRSVENVVSQMADHAPMRVLGKHEAFRFFRRLLNPSQDIADTPRLKRDTGLARQVCDSDIEWHRDGRMSVGKQYVRVLTLKDMPRETYANLLRPIIESESQCYLATEWRRVSNRKITKLIKTKLNHVKIFANPELLRGIAVAFAGKKEEDRVAAEGPSKSEKTTTDLLEDAQSAIDNEGLTFGYVALSIVIRDSDPARLALSVSRLYKAMASLGVDVYDETLGVQKLYFATIPGNAHRQKRYQCISVKNYADLSFLFRPQPGQLRNEQLNDEYLLALGTRQNTLYTMNLHYGDSPHTFTCGVNGAGKSFLWNAIITHAQKYNPWTLIFDVGGSYRGITERFGGSYLDMDQDRQQVQINPFCLPPTRHNLHFVFSFIRLLIESGEFEYKLSAEDKRDLFQRVVATYRLDPKDRTLGMLYTMLRLNLKPHLARWVRFDDRKRPGQYGTLFDNAEDALTLARFQVFDFQGVEDVPELAEPLLFYILHRSRATVYDPAQAGVYKLVVADECWRFLNNEVTRAYFISALKTWRKHNAAMHLITQNPEDMEAANVGRILTEAQTSILLANPRMNEDVYRRLFKLNDTKIAHIKGLQPKREFLFDQPRQSKILRLDASPVELDLYSSTPQKEQEKRKIA